MVSLDNLSSFPYYERDLDSWFESFFSCNPGEDEDCYCYADHIPHNEDLSPLSIRSSKAIIDSGATVTHVPNNDF